MRKLWATVLQTSGAKVYSLATGILVLFVTARLLGPEGRGQVAAITTWVALFSTLVSMSLGQVALHRVAQDPERHRIGELLGSLLGLAGVLTAVGWFFACAAFFVGHAFDGLPRIALIVAFLGLPLMIWEQYGSSLLMSLERLDIYNRYQVLGRSLSIAAVVILIAVLGWGVTGAVTAGIVGQLVVATGGVSFLFKHVHANSSYIRVSRTEVLALLVGGAKLHLNAIGTFLFTSASVLILNHYRTSQEVGQFQLASQMVSILIVVPQAASAVISGKVAAKGPDGAWPENRTLLFQVCILMAAAAAILAAAAPWAIPFLAGPAFEGSIAPFQWMLLAVFGMTFSSVMGPQWIGRGYFWQAATLTFAVGAVNLGTNFLLIPRLGIPGAVISYLGTYLLSLLGNGFMIRHCERQSRRASFSAAAHV